MSDIDSYIFPLEGKGIFNEIVVGTSGKGHSAVIQRLAEQEGVSYEEMEARMQPSKDDLEKDKVRREKALEAENKRLQLVRDAYWSGSKLDDFDPIVSSLCVELDAEWDDFKSEHIQAVFNLLPVEIVGDVIKWGMSDTEVRGTVHEFVEDNLGKVQEALNQVEINVKKGSD